MRRAVLLTASAVLLGCPTVLAFASGGYFDKPRYIATLVVWTLVLVVAIASPRPLPKSWRGRMALGGIALLAAWTGASITWAPLSGPASDSFVRLLLYLGAFAAAAAVLRDRLTAAAVEPALALGTVVVIGYGLAGRLLPGLIHLSHSAKAGDRLEQPITYWNAEGALAAVGFVLCVRLAGTTTRPAALRSAAAAASVLLGVGVYLTYSRGVVAALAVGLVVLLAVAPSWPGLRALAVALAATVAAAAAASALPGVGALDGSLSSRESDGAVMLGLLLVAMAAAGLAQWRMTRSEAGGRAAVGELGIASKLPAVAAVALCAGIAGLVIGGLGEKGRREDLARRQGASRLTSIQSRRYDYWRIGLRAFRDHPLKGVGAGGFRVVWVRERPVPEGALEVHSLLLETALELGVLGLLGLGMLVGGTAASGWAALRRRPTLAAGAAAAGTVWVLHAGIDWTWQLPAVTLPVLILCGALVAGSEDWPEEGGEGGAVRDRAGRVGQAA